MFYQLDQHLSKVHEIKRKTTGQSVFYLSFQKFLKRLFAGNSLIIFRKGCSPQHGLLLMIDKWKKTVDNHKVFGAVLNDLSKAFDCICHDLLIVKLNACGLSLTELKLIPNYLQNRKQRTKMGSIYSDWEDITSGVSEGSILGSLLLNIFLCHLFLENENNYFANYADGTTPYFVRSSTTTEVLENLSGITKILFT